MAVLPDIDRGDQTQNYPRKSLHSPDIAGFAALTFTEWQDRSTDWKMERGRLKTALILAEMATAEASRRLVDETAHGSAVTRLGNAARVVTAIAINGEASTAREGLQGYMEAFVGEPDRPLTLGGVDEMIRDGSITQGWLNARTEELQRPHRSPFELSQRNSNLDVAMREAESDTIPALRILGVMGRRQFDVFERIEGNEVTEWPHLQISDEEMGPFAAAAMLQVALLAHNELGSSLTEVAASRPLHTADVVSITEAPSVAARVAVGY